MEEIENKSKSEELTELMEKITEAMQMSRDKQANIDNITEELNNETRIMMVEKRKEELESAENDKDEFDEMTKNGLIRAKKEILELREESEKEYQEKLVYTVKRQNEIQKKLESIKETLLYQGKIDKFFKAEEKANNALEKVTNEMKEYQQSHFELREQLDNYEKDIYDYAIEIGVEKEIDNVVLTTPATTPATTVPTRPATTPATTVPTRPATTPVSTVPTRPATTPATTVPTRPATTPATTVPTRPATTPATTVPTRPATTPASTPPTKLENISITFDAKKGMYTLLKEKSGQKIQMYYDEIRAAKEFEKFVDFSKERYEDYDRRNVDAFVAYLLYKNDKTSRTNNLDTYIKSLTRAADFPKNIKLTYNMNGIYSRQYTEEYSDRFMRWANHVKNRKLAEVNKGVYVKFLEKHDKIRHAVAKINEFINKRDSKVKLLSDGKDSKDKKIKVSKEAKKIKKEINRIHSLGELKKFRAKQYLTHSEDEKVVNSALDKKKEQLEITRRRQIIKVFQKQRKNNINSENISRNDEVPLSALSNSTDDVNTEPKANSTKTELAHGFVQRVNVTTPKGSSVNIEQIKEKNKVELSTEKGE